MTDVNNVKLREPRAEDWPVLAALGNTAISEMESPPDQAPSADNRRSFPSDGIQRHFVVEYEADTGLLAFMEQVGFKFFRALTTPDGFHAVQMTMDAPFDSLAISN